MVLLTNRANFKPKILKLNKTKRSHKFNIQLHVETYEDPKNYKIVDQTVD